MKNLKKKKKRQKKKRLSKLMIKMNYSNSYRKEMLQQWLRKRKEDSLDKNYNFIGLKKYKRQEVNQSSHKSQFIR